MDPQVALDTFNQLGTCRAERQELVEGLWEWLSKGGMLPEGRLNVIHIVSLKEHGEWGTALLAERINEYLEGRWVQ